MALEAIDYARLRRRARRRRRARGKLRGFGISTYIEACGIAPSALVGALGARRRALRGGDGARPSDRQRDGVHRHPQPRPGARDDLRPARLATSSASRSRTSRSSTATPTDPVRHGHLRLALGGGRRLGDRQGDGQDRRQGQEDRRPSAGGERRRHRVRGRQLHASPAPTAPRRFGEVALRRLRAAQLSRSTSSSRGWRRRPSTIPRTSPSRPARHIVEVEIDPETGVVAVVETFMAVDDFGGVINPMIVEGQVARRPRSGHRPGAAGRVRSTTTRRASC